MASEFYNLYQSHCNVSRPFELPKFESYVKLCLICILCRINYALFEELEAQDMDRTRDVYKYD
jgi:hypothetical protein